MSKKKESEKKKEDKTIVITDHLNLMPSGRASRYPVHYRQARKFITAYPSRFSLDETEMEKLIQFEK